MRQVWRWLPASSTCSRTQKTRLITDGRSQGEIRQGVTTQIFGEGSMGPLSDEMKQRRAAAQGDSRSEVPWTTLPSILTYLEKRGVSQNVASFVSATTVRENVIGLEDKAPTAEQLDRMRELVRQEMEAGALGVTTALIYPPAFLRQDRRVDRALQSRREIQGQIHRAYSQRRESVDRSRRGDASHQPRGRAARQRSIT